MRNFFYLLSLLFIRQIFAYSDLKVVGVLSIPTSQQNTLYSNQSFSMIPSSYVKWLEQTGVKIIVIQYDLSVN